jgi:hypothetical protein
MNINLLIPKVDLRLQFSLGCHKFVPKEAGCYVLTTFDGTILYIGLTDNLYRRFSEHRNSKDKNHQTAHGTAFWFYYLICEESKINLIERTWLNSHATEAGLLPILNKVNSPVR